MTNGTLIASHSSDRFDGVCDHPLFVADARARVFVGDGSGGETSLVGEAWLAVEVRVARLRGELVALGVAVAISGSSKSEG